MSFRWDFENPYLLEKTVEADDIDIMGHTNNVVYLKWLEQVAWSHSNSLGLGWEVYETLNRALVARRHELDYLAATFEGDQLTLATWIIENDGRIGVTRAYQVIRHSDGKTVLRGRTRWVCIDLKSGKPKRMPDEFVNGYVVAAPAG
jgi:acyl-CoA thioester hydrolase